MNTEQIIKGNKLIAEFMQLPTFTDYKGIMYDYQRSGKEIYSIRAEQLGYYRSWDWQVPAWSNIVNAIGLLWQDKNVLPNKWAGIKSNYAMAINGNNINVAFEILVTSIQWYNTQSKP